MCKVIELKEYIRKREQVEIRHSYQFPAVDKVTWISLEYIKNGDPGAVIRAAGKEYSYPLTTGFEVYNMNDYLRKFNLGLEIKFETYTQYGFLLMKCSELIRKRNSGRLQLYNSFPVSATTPTGEVTENQDEVISGT